MIIYKHKQRCLLTYKLYGEQQQVSTEFFGGEYQMPNDDIRREAAGAGVKLWQIAGIIGYTDSYFSRKLRYELPAEEKAKIRHIIHELATN